MALLLAGVMTCAAMAAASPGAAVADAVQPVELQMSPYSITDGSWMPNASSAYDVKHQVLVSYSDGSFRGFMLTGPDWSHYPNPEITVYYGNERGFPVAKTLSISAGSVAEIPGLPGVVVGVVMTAYNGSSDTLVNARAYGVRTEQNVVVGLKNKPPTQSATVAAVPTTGAPSSDFVIPAALLAAGMVGGGLLVRGRHDRGRA